MTEVAVSAGEPVAWLVQSPIPEVLPWVALSPVEAGAAKERGHSVTPIPASAPVVLPEEPPAELIEQMAKAAQKKNGVEWDALHEGLKDFYCREQRESYAVLRAWVAGGGEAR